MLYVGLLTTIIMLGVIFKCHTFLLFLSFHIVLFTPPVRVVFAVTMEGSARKVITVDQPSL